MRPQPPRPGSLRQAQLNAPRHVYVWEHTAIAGPQLVLSNKSALYGLTTDERSLRHRHSSTMARQHRRVCGQIAICASIAICEQFRRMRKAPGVTGGFSVSSGQSLLNMLSSQRISVYNHTSVTVRPSAMPHAAFSGAPARIAWSARSKSSRKLNAAMPMQTIEKRYAIGPPLRSGPKLAAPRRRSPAPS